jgi:hypothetical protein
MKRWMVEKWLIAIKELEEHDYAFFKGTGQQWLHTAQGNAAYHVADRYTQAVMVCIGDEDEWLRWYWHENGLGEKALLAQPSGGKRKLKINSLDRLYWVLEI